jgi:hypothetical protein
MLKNKLIYLCSLILIGALAILYNEYYTGIIFIAWLVMPFIMFAILVITWSNVKVKIVTNSFVASKDDFFDINIKIINKSWFPVSRMDILLAYGNQYGKDIIKEKIQISMDKHCKQEVSTKVSSSYCGNITFRLITIKVYDFFHIFTLTKKLNKSINISILPICYSIDDFITENATFISDSNEFSPYKSGDDPSEVFQIREYREGDKTSRIHRKLSYKYNEMMMKEYSSPINTMILLIFDLYCGQNKYNKIEIVDSLLHVLMAVSMLGIENNYKQSVFYKMSGLDCMETGISSENDIYELLESLFVLDIPKDFISLLPLHIEYDTNVQYSHMTLISCSIDVEGIISWSNLHQGTIITVMYVNYLDTDPIAEKDRLILESLYIKIFEIDIRNMKVDLDTLI